MKEIKGSLSRFNVRGTLIFYDIGTFLVVDFLLLVIYQTWITYNALEVIVNSTIALSCVLVCRFSGKIYRQIWRFGGIQCYIRFLITDAAAFCLFVCLEFMLQYSFGFKRLSFVRMIAIMSLNLIITLGMRMFYRYCYKCGNEITWKGKVLRAFLKVFAKGVEVKKQEEYQKIKVAIVGAGAVGVNLAEDLILNANSAYTPRCFFDISDKKAGREIQGLPVFKEDNNTFEILKEYEIQEIIFALPPSIENRKELYDYYKQSGCKIKVYDYPLMQKVGKKGHLREFDIEDLLFRKPINVSDEKTNAYFADKVVLITGGGGSIGCELCRQLAKMKPKQIVISDIYENGAYNVQQELKFKYNDNLDIRVEIASITNEKAMTRIFLKYHPQIVINAAAHKHVPLMENNCIEAVENNVFGTKIILDLCENYSVERFMMVSTDKAVNPTNVMGATKRMCEMITLAYGSKGNVKCSCTRFGNVLGSAGSVIPLFKKQIAAGGPVTITDKRIIRYFMTIQEASQLVLQSGAMAQNNELFVLDMGQPVKIYDLAKNMISLSGVPDVKIVETGLRPGEKLYEELLVDAKKLDVTDNELIFIEREKPISFDDMKEKLVILKNACDSENENNVRKALRQVVPTFKRTQDVNADADNAIKMYAVKRI